MNAEEILRFWFHVLTPEDWFRKDESLDQLIRERFSETLTMASRGGLAPWRDTPEGRLAEIIVLDQFSRNIHRGKKEAFENDLKALFLAEELVTLGWDKRLTSDEKIFAYMPYMHSESLVVHELAVQLFSEPGLKENLAYEKMHKEIIEKFGRYPHRNQILNRDSTPSEIEFVKTHPGF